MKNAYLGDELSSDDQALVAVNRALSSQLGHHELKHVVRVSSHHSADLLEVHPKGLLGTDCTKRIRKRTDVSCQFVKSWMCINVVEGYLSSAEEASL